MKEKLHNLVVDERSWKTRLGYAALVSAACAFSFIIFGIFELFVNNMSIMPFTFQDIAFPVILMAIIAFVLLTAIVMIFRGKLFNLVISIGVGILIAGYLQGTFLNSHLGQITGDVINWSEYTSTTLWNLLLWVVLILLPIIILYFSKNVWKKVVIFVPVIIAGMQLVGLISICATTDLNANIAKYESYVSEQGIYELSSKENTIVILLDRLDGKYIDELLEADPNYFEPLNGFTYFKNHTSLYCRTFPSVAYMFSGEVSYYEEPGEEFLEKAWENAKIFDDLQENNYNVGIYVPEGYVYSAASQMEGKADNVIKGTPTVKTMSILKRMLKFSAYRYAPYALKPSLIIPANAFEDTVIMEQEPGKYLVDDFNFYNNLKTEKLTLQNEENCFRFYHLNGIHMPYNMTEDVTQVPDGESDLIGQIKGCFQIVYEFLQQLKDLGIYENSTIIITGDHGFSMDANRLDTYKTTGLFIKPKGSQDMPMQYSYAPVSHENFRATIVDSAGIETEEYGDTVFEVAEDADVTRRFLYRVDEEGGSILEEFEIRGNAEDFANWEKVNEYPMPYPYG